MSTPTTTIEPKKESLGISAALILSLVGLTLLLVIAILIKREIRRGNVKSKRDGHFWWCEFFRKYIDSRSAKDGKIPAKVRPQWLLVGHHELPNQYYTKNECPQYIARMFTIDLYTVLQNTCRETFIEFDSNRSVESYLFATYPSLSDTIHTFRRLKTRAEVDLVPFTIDETKRAIEVFNELLQKLSEFAHNPYLREREVDLTLFNQLDDQNQMSSKYIPLLPKDLCQIPLRATDEDSLGNRNKRSRSKGRFPFHLPSFLHKKKLFSSKSSNSPPQNSANNRNQSITTTENSFDDPNQLDRQARHRSKRLTATDVIPLVEFHDALSNSTTFASDNEQQT